MQKCKTLVEVINDCTVPLPACFWKTAPCPQVVPSTGLGKPPEFNLGDLCAVTEVSELPPGSLGVLWPHRDGDKLLCLPTGPPATPSSYTLCSPHVNPGYP